MPGKLSPGNFGVLRQYPPSQDDSLMDPSLRQRRFLMLSRLFSLMAATGRLIAGIPLFAMMENDEEEAR